jgi:hypothetical protein
MPKEKLQPIFCSVSAQTCLENHSFKRIDTLPKNITTNLFDTIASFFGISYLVFLFCAHHGELTVLLMWRLPHWQTEDSHTPHLLPSMLALVLLRTTTMRGATFTCSMRSSSSSISSSRETLWWRHSLRGILSPCSVMCYSLVSHERSGCKFATVQKNCG